MNNQVIIFLLTSLSMLSVNSFGNDKLRELVILHTNDMHARVIGVKPDNNMCSLAESKEEFCFGGFARIMTQVNLERKKHANTVLLDAGDQFQGSMFHSIYKGLASVQLMNKIGYQAMAVGNHEFDHGPQALANFIKEMNFPLLSANIDASLSPELKDKIKPYVIIEQNGLKIGVIGYTTEDTKHLSSPGSRVKFLDIISSVKKSVALLKAAKVDVIIALSHSGLLKDREIASKVDGLAAIISGHSNSLLSNVQKNSDGPCPLVQMSPSNKPVLLVSAYAYGKFLGRLWFAFDQNGVPTKWEGEPILLDKSIAPNEEVTALIEKIYPPITEFEKKQVGLSPTQIDAQNCRFAECDFGNFITDSLLSFAKKFGASIALLNGGAIRASLPKGVVNQAHINNVLPFDEKISLVKLKGRVIKDIIEHGVSQAEDRNNDNTGRFLQVSGLQYTFDIKNPVGKRIKNIKLLGENGQLLDFDEDAMFGVVTSSYLVEGGDSFSFFAKASEHWTTPITLRDHLIEVMKAPVSLPTRKGRIEQVKEEIHQVPKVVVNR